MSRCNRITLAIIASCFMGTACAAELLPGQPAPPFQLPDQSGEMHSLSDYRGRWVVLYFYPKDDTPGCTEEACRFRDDILRLDEMGAQVLGASLDDRDSHARFADKHNLQFPLLSDTSGAVVASYGSLRNLGILKVARRHTFIIDPGGRIAKIYRKVSPSDHSEQVISDLKELQREYAAASG
ncbi:MAG: peroxiredoxin [Gammaproteobacteria bacterium]|nr:peroxiredoxin [Gammaproteobacteria bacterium]